MTETSIDKLINLLQVSNVSPKELMETMNEIRFCSPLEVSNANNAKDTTLDRSITTVENQEECTDTTSNKMSVTMTEYSETSGNVLKQDTSSVSMQGTK